MTTSSIQRKWIVGECLNKMQDITDGSVDMILCDLPYGTTQNKWDTVIPLDELWKLYWQVLKPNGAIILTAQQPFTTILGASQIEHLKYSWILEKTRGTGFLNAKYQPLRSHDDALVFYKKHPTYNPQFLSGKPYREREPKCSPGSTSYNKIKRVKTSSLTGDRYPRSVLKFKSFNNADQKQWHPTQKPVEIFEYMINTYSNIGDTILDNCAGSGTTAVASDNLNRNWICIEKNENYSTKAQNRIKTNYETPKEILDLTKFF